MTIEAEEMAAVQRGLDNLPRPALDRLPKGSAARRLAEALGRPALAARVVELCGPYVSVVLAEAVDGAVVRRANAFEAQVAADLDQVHAEIVDRWNEPDCVSPEPEGGESGAPLLGLVEAESLAGGKGTPEFVTAARYAGGRWRPSFFGGVAEAALEAAEQDRVNRFMAGGN